jgi:hypothetical protein
MAAETIQTPPTPPPATRPQDEGQPVRFDRGLCFFLILVTIAIATVHVAGDSHYDFGVFYYASRIVWDGAGSSLYHLDLQQQYQLRYGRPPDFLFYYPPFSLLPFLPFAGLPVLGAFLGWTVLNLGLVTASVTSLSRRLGFRYGNWPVVLSLAFMPVSTNLAHGQVALVALAGYVLCYLAWRRGRWFEGGMALALAAFKPQLVAGFLLVLLLRRRWRELAGFAAGCVPLVLVSCWMVGFRALLAYPQFLLQCEGGPGIDPLKMANLRGLVTLVPGGGHVAAILVLSLAAVAAAAWRWRDLESGFAAAIIATCLVSYHFNPQDLSLMLIPLFFAIRRAAPSWKNVLAGSAVSAPLLCSILGEHLFVLLALPLVFLLVAFGRGWLEGDSGRPGEAAQSAAV